MVYGVDLFFFRSTPDRAFDMFTDGFNYVQLIAVLIIGTVGVLYLRNKEQ